MLKKVIILLFLVLFGINSYSQCPGPVIGTAVAIPTGSFNCNQQNFPSPIGIDNDGGSVTMCFNYFNVGPVTLNFILVSGLCGPVPLYNTLSFTIYDSSCTSIITSGTIVPVANNNIINNLGIGVWYTICYTWVPNCQQYSACPLIYTITALPVELLNFEGFYDSENNRNTLFWSTASEKNSDYFEITKSYDFASFFDPIRIKSNGNTSTLSQYSCIDKNFERNKTIYYKLTEVDYDGNRQELSIISINSFYNNNLEVEIFDVLGRKQKNFVDGVNIIKRGNTYSKVVKIKENGN